MIKNFKKIPDIVKDDINTIINSFIHSPLIFNIKKIILFGSFAKNKYQPDSDIDVAIILKTMPPSHLKIEYYTTVDINRIVDIVLCTEETLNSNKYVYKNILKEGVIIFENL